MPEKFISEAKQNYIQILNYITKSQQSVIKTATVDISDIIPLARKIVTFMKRSKDLSYYAINYYDPKDLFVSHSANVAIFSTTIGIGLKYSDEELLQLCAAGILHDIGITKIPAQIKNETEEELGKEEIHYFRKHSKLGYESIEKNSEFSEKIAQVALHHHERNDGSGFPDQLSGDDIHPHARIISLIDVYEALIHPRSHRDKLVPPAGIQQIIKNKGNYFSKPILKALINYISIYPIGTYVKLSSDEVARVVDLNSNNPVRPKVRVIYNSKGQKIEPYLLDLVKEPLIHIKKCLPYKIK